MALGTLQYIVPFQAAVYCMEYVLSTLQYIVPFQAAVEDYQLSDNRQKGSLCHHGHR